MQKYFSLIILVLLLITAVPTTSAEDFRFVDAEDETGYYVDMDNIKNESNEIVIANIAVIKANLNRMYIYNVRINHKMNRYQIISSKIIEYDTKNIVEANDNVRAFRPYSPNSEMSEVIRYIYKGGDLP